MALVDRVKNILMSPRSEWQVIDAEPDTVASLYTGYIMPLAAIPAICSAIGMSMIGYTIPIVGGHYRTPIGSALVGAVVRYVLSLVVIYVTALIVDALAPSFSGTKNQVQALKVVAYSYTAAWVGGVFSIIPNLGVVGLLFSLYSLYLLYLGLPVLMKSPVDKAVGYTLVVIVVSIVLFMVVFGVVGMLGMGMGAAAMSGAGAGYRP